LLAATREVNQQNKKPRAKEKETRHKVKDKQSV
jgi:hypothetical protein